MSEVPFDPDRHRRFQHFVAWDGDYQAIKYFDDRLEAEGFAETIKKEYQDVKVHADPADRGSDWGVWIRQRARQEVALFAEHQSAGRIIAELDRPSVVQVGERPDTVSGRFLNLSLDLRGPLDLASSRQMIFSEDQTLYEFTVDEHDRFTASVKR